jgi:acyl carrier protein
VQGDGLFLYIGECNLVMVNKDEGYMSLNKQKYDRVFIQCFSIPENTLDDALVYNSIPEWDSIGHMTLIAGLEETFGIMMETDDIINFSSYAKGVEILKKYNIEQ